MPDDYVDLKSQDGKKQDPQETEEMNSWWIGRWAHVVAGLLFCVLYFPLSSYVWSWQAAATLSYIVFMVCCTCGLSFQDSDEFFGDLAVPEYIGSLVMRQILILAFISVGFYEWHHLIPVLPGWAKARAVRNLSLWEVGGLVLQL